MRRLAASLLVLMLAAEAGAQTAGKPKRKEKPAPPARENELWFDKYDGIGFLLSPGFWRSSAGDKGYEVSALYFLSEQGNFSAFGLVFGETYSGRDLRYLELQAGGSGMLLGSLNLGLGRYEVSKPEKVPGYQSTLTVHFFIPVFAFARAKWEKESPADGSEKFLWQSPEFGFMFKIPLPAIYNDRGNLKFFRL